MMNEIIRARNALTPYLSLQGEETTKQSRTIYNFKRHAIQSCLYGVDIDPGAVEIAKLRLWLSLIVDEEDINKIKPLPNLDYKIVCGNSLLGVERNLENWKLFAKLEELKPLFFNETNANKKQEYKIQIDGIISEITNGHKDFDFEVYFSEVFHEKNGFDVVIANPPYLGFQGIDRSFKKLLQKLYTSVSGKYDLYVPFIEKGFYLLRRNGFFVFICPTAFTKRDYGNKIRKFLLENTQLLELVDFEHTQIFTEATNYTGVFSFIKANLEHNKLKYKTGLSNKLIEILQEQFSESPWIFRDSEAEQIISKIGNNTKLNEISVISEGIVTGLNELYLKSEEELSLKQFGCDCFYPCYRGKEIGRYHLKSNSEFVFYPYGLVDNKTIPFDEKDLRQRCPNYIAYLQENIQLIRKREYFINSNKKWYELWNQRNLSNFTTLKIITPELSDRNRFTIASANTYYGDTVCGIRIKDKYKNRIKLKYLLAVLNSELIEWFYKKTTVPKAGGFFIYKVMYLKNIPLKEISIDNQKPFISLVDKILAITKDDDYLTNSLKQAKVKEYEHQINEMVYKLYGLTEEEIKVIEESIK